MDKLSSFSLCDTESLDWTQSEVKSQNVMSFVGDSQFPLSSLICLDSQDIGDRCVSQDRLFPAIFSDSFETTASLDMGRWDLAAGEVKSQSPAENLGQAEAVMCPPPSLDTQEFEIRYARSEHLSSLECQSMERSSLDEMGRWDLADGEAISQALVRPLREAETPPCPLASLDTQEFERRCVEPVGKTPVNYLDTSMKSSADTLGFSDSGDIKDSPRSPTKFFVGENMTLRSPAALDDQDLEVGLTRKNDVSSLKSLELAELTPGQEKSQIPLNEFYKDTQIQPRLVCLRTHQVPSPWVASKDASAVQPISSLDLAEINSSKESPFPNWSGSRSRRNDVEDNVVISKDGLVKYKSSESAEHIGCETKTDFPLLHPQDLVTTTEFQVAVGSAVQTGISAGLLDVPSFNHTPDKHGIVNGHRKKRKNQNLLLSSDDTRSPTTLKRSVIKLGRTLRGNAAPCRSPLRPLRFSSSLITDEKYGGVTEAKHTHELKGVKIEAEYLENMARAAVQELFPSGQTYPTGKENVGCHGTLKQLDAAVSATSKTIKREPQSDNVFLPPGEEHPSSSNHLKISFQTLKQSHILEVGPRHNTLWVTNILGKSISSIQTQLSSRVGSNSHLAKAKVPEDHERTQEWRCPKASKRLLYNKPRQRSLDGWLK
ncbi:hypothetical protein Mapa_015611 [Marchantia paleacea]|nr:hypothetical protein Mapa_015611 [Marchantia paleacea]